MEPQSLSIFLLLLERKVPLVLPAQTELMVSMVHKALLVLLVLLALMELTVRKVLLVHKASLALPVQTDRMESMVHPLIK